MYRAPALPNLRQQGGVSTPSPSTAHRSSASEKRVAPPQPPRPVQTMTPEAPKPPRAAVTAKTSMHLPSVRPWGKGNAQNNEQLAGRGSNRPSTSNTIATPRSNVPAGLPPQIGAKTAKVPGSSVRINPNATTSKPTTSSFRSAGKFHYFPLLKSS